MNLDGLTTEPWSRGKKNSNDDTMEEWCLGGTVWLHTEIPWIEETVVMIIVDFDRPGCFIIEE